MKLLSYLIAWFYDILIHLPKSLISLLPGSPTEITVTYVAVIFPVVMFGLTIIAFFLLTREISKEIFKEKTYYNLVALLSCLVLALSPVILPRTIAGIPEKESVGFLFIFLSFYFFILMMNVKKNNSSVKKRNFKTGLYGVLAGIFTACLGLTWGGIIFVFSTIGVLGFIMFIFDGMNKRRFLGYSFWIIASTLIMMLFSIRYRPMNLLTSTSTIPIFATWFFSAFNLFIYPKLKMLKKYEEKFRINSKIMSILIISVMGILAMGIILGPSFFWLQIKDLYNQFIRPLGITRFGLTVAENKQPFFGEWSNSFGPLFSGIPLMFSMFLAGTIVLFLHLVKKFDKKNRRILTLGFIIGIFGSIFSRYSSSSIFNGTNFTSTIIYLGSITILIVSFSYVYYLSSKSGKLEEIPKKYGIILFFIFMGFSIIAARGAIRFIMVLVPAVSFFTSYLLVTTLRKTIVEKDSTKKIIAIILLIVLAAAFIFSVQTYFNSSLSSAINYSPSAYQWQWQSAMAWVRENTETSAVFAHWWDYGYWVQSIGERATILDGGNAIIYWNHLMGRHVLTAKDDFEGLNFLYTHNATHLLIDSTELGKYSAYSLIGGDENNDRVSVIPSFFLSQNNIQETKDGIKYVYTGGASLDDDLVYEVNGSKKIFAKENYVIAAILFEEKNDGSIRQPEIILVNIGNRAQEQIPIRYIYYKNNEEKLQDFGSGIDAGIFIVESISQAGGSVQLEEKGVAIYLGPRTIHSLVARKYLFGEEGNFKLVHNEPNYFVNNLREQGLNVDDFVYFGGSFLGPIKIWEINYPAGVEYKPEYLEREFPDDRVKYAD